MLYMPPVDMQRDMYTGPHGLDFKKYNELYPDWHKLMDEKEFFADPHSVAHGAADRMFYRKLYLKYRNQICAIRHILNTGQGVVMEGCLNSDPIYMNAAVNAGFLQGESKKYIFKIIFKEKIVKLIFYSQFFAFGSVKMLWNIPFLITCYFLFSPGSLGYGLRLYYSRAFKTQFDCLFGCSS